MIENPTNRSSSNASWFVGALLSMVLILLTGLIFLTQEPRQIDTPSSIVAVTINGQPVFLGDFEKQVRLQEFRIDLSDQPGLFVDREALLNRLIIDILILQAADGEGIEVDSSRVQDEIISILEVQDSSREEFSELLASHDLSWTFFEKSVEEFLIQTDYVVEVIWEDTPANERQAKLLNWVTDQFGFAEIDFDQEFLDGLSGQQ
jgi:hypothetical protein